MITEPDTTQRSDVAGADPSGARSKGRAPTVWLHRSVAALAALTAVVVVTGGYLTVRYRPGARIDGARGARPALVSAAQVLHTLSAYAFALVVCVVVGAALLVAHRRNHASGVILASGFGLFIVSIGFLVTGRELPWRGFVWVAPGFSRSFDGIIGFPKEVIAVLVGSGRVTPARYETIAWIHIAGLPVFAVFAAWWMLGAVQASRRTEDARAVGASAPAGPPAGAGTEQARPVTLGEQFFGTDDPATVRLQVDAFLTRHLGTGIAALDFTRTGSGILLGVTLADGRPAVVRLYAPGADAAFLRAVQAVQRELVGHGFPAPQPLLEPTPFGVGLATVEGRLFDPPRSDPVDAAARYALASVLASFVRVAAPLAQLGDLRGRGPLRPPAPGSAFPEAAGAGLDLAATATGAEWIEELGARARAILDAAPPSPPVVGHFAWRAETVALVDGHVVGVFGWDEIGSAPEAVVLGCAAHQFTLDPRSPTPHVPTADEIRAFVADYEATRGAPLTTPERVAARAAYVYCTALAARGEHALALTGHPAPARFRERLAVTGALLG